MWLSMETPCEPMDCSLSGFQSMEFLRQNTGVGCHVLHVYGEGADKAVFRLKSYPHLSRLVPLEEKQETPESKDGQATEGCWSHSKNRGLRRKQSNYTWSGNFMPPGLNLCLQLEIFI